MAHWLLTGFLNIFASGCLDYWTLAKRISEVVVSGSGPAVLLLLPLYVFSSAAVQTYISYSIEMDITVSVDVFLK